MDRCPLKTCHARLELRTDGLGRVIAHCPGCARRKAGVCRDCPRPVYGAVGKALRCREHARAAIRQADRRSRDANREARRAAQRARWRADAEHRARKAEAHRAWTQAHPDRVKLHRRRYHLKRTEGYVAGYLRQNQRPERIARKRELARARYYEQHPTRPVPVCRLCGAPIPFTGTGRPRVTCQARGRCERVAVAA